MKNMLKAKVIQKPWGKEEILETNEFYTVKRLTMLKNCKCSKQYHNDKKETIYVLFGKLWLYVNDYLVILEKGYTYTINPKDVHRMEAKDKKAIYLECSTSQLDDVVRLEDDYNRV